MERLKDAGGEVGVCACLGVCVSVCVSVMMCISLCPSVCVCHMCLYAPVPCDKGVQTPQSDTVFILCLIYIHYSDCQWIWLGEPVHNPPSDIILKTDLPEFRASSVCPLGR